MIAWSPPSGSVEVEPGYWEAPNGSLYQTPESMEAMEAERLAAARERDRLRREEDVRRRPRVIEMLQARCEALELSLYLRSIVLDSCLQLLEEQREQLVFERGLLRAVLAERAPVLRVVDQKEAA